MMESEKRAVKQIIEQLESVRFFRLTERWDGMKKHKKKQGKNGDDKMIWICNDRDMSNKTELSSLDTEAKAGINKKHS